MDDINFDGLNSGGIATGKFIKLIGQKQLKERIRSEFSANKVTPGNIESIIINVFGDWGLGKSHLAYKLFSEINGLSDTNRNELASKKFSDNSICIILNYKFIKNFDLQFNPKNIALAGAYWLDDETYSIYIGNKNDICFSTQREKIINELKTLDLQQYHSQFTGQGDNDYNSFEALKIFLNENNTKRLIIIIDEIEELEQSASGFARINISNLYERLATFVSTASDSPNEKYRIGFIFLISQKMYDKVKEYIEETESSGARRFMNTYLKRYSNEDMLDFLNERLTDTERQFIKPFEDYFSAIWEACNRNFGWFEVAAKNLCLELSENKSQDLQVIAQALKKTKKNRFSIFNQIGYLNLLNTYTIDKEIVNSFCLKTFPQNLSPHSNLINNLVVKCGEVSLKIDPNGVIVDKDFTERLKQNDSIIGEMIKFGNSIGSIPIESIVDSLYPNGDNKYLTYFTNSEYQFHLTWAANRKLDLFFTEKLKDSLRMEESQTFFLLSTEKRREIYPYYKPNISPNWIKSKKLREIKEFLES